MPRSPSRDVVDRFTGNRGYFHRGDPLRRWKNLVAIGAVGLVLGWLLVELAFPARAASAHSHGELANPHAAFDSNCQACHQNHSLGEFFSNPLSVFRAQSRWRDVSCTKCHAGPAHHAAAKDQSFHNDCSNCHHDHQGREASLVRMSDQHCVRCHADLPAAHQSGQSEFTKSITSFSGEHPEFRSLQTTRTLKFSHALHMTPGLVYAANDQHAWTPNSLSRQFGADAGKRYSSASGQPSDPIQLTCASCHTLGSGRVPAGESEGQSDFDLKLNSIRGAPQQSILPPRTAGAYYLPVNFDLHCKTCHPLRTPTAVSGGIVLKEFAVPHRRPFDALRTVIRGEYAARLTAGKHPILAQPIGPGGRLDPAADPAVRAFGSELDQLTNAALKALTQNLAPLSDRGIAPSGGFACGKCHYSTGPGQLDVLPLPDKSVWLEHATFNHVSHRGLTCASCHPGTEGGFAANGAVNEREPVLIAGIKSCQACHAEAGKAIELPNGQTVHAAGIRHSCTDCHRYHNGDRPLQGLGSLHRDPKSRLSLGEFLRGGKDQP